MKRKKQLLRLRPFNMANFSSGSSMLEVVGILGLFTTLPATLMLWAGIALPMKPKEHELDYDELQGRNVGCALPICAVFFIVNVLLVYALDSGNLAFSANNIVVYILAIIFIAGFPTLGIYGIMHYSAKRDSEKAYLTKGGWLASLMKYAVLLAVIGGIGTAILTRFI